MNKRGGPIGDLVVIFPTIIAVVVIMGVFVALAAAFSIRAPENQNAVFSSGVGSPLLYSVDGNNGSELLFDSVFSYDPSKDGGAAEYSSGIFFEGSIAKNIKSFFEKNAKDGECIYFRSDVNNIVFLRAVSDNGIKIVNLIGELDKSKLPDLTGRLRSVSFRDGNGEIKEVVYYYGICSEVENE